MKCRGKSDHFGGLCALSCAHLSIMCMCICVPQLHKSALHVPSYNRDSLPKSWALPSAWCIAQFRILAIIPLPTLQEDASSLANVRRNFIEVAFRGWEQWLKFYRNHIRAVKRLVPLQLLRVGSYGKIGAFFLEDSRPSVKRGRCTAHQLKSSSHIAVLCQFKLMIVRCVQSRSVSWNTLCPMSESTMLNDESFITCMCLSGVSVVRVLLATTSVYLDRFLSNCEFSHVVLDILVLLK